MVDINSERTCATCLAFRRAAAGAEGEHGRCALRPELDAVSATSPWCSKYVARDGSRAKPRPAVRPRGTRPDRDDDPAPSAPERAYGTTIDLGEGDMETEALRALIKDVLTEDGLLGHTAMAKRWEGGTLVMKPGSDELKPKEMPLEAFFHKIVMVRDRLRVLEQKINGHAKLSDQEKVDMQQYITRVYGSLTSFNALFRDSGDQFVGSKGD